MPNYVGLPSGHVLSFRGPSALSHVGGRPYSYVTTLKGRRRAQMAPGRRLRRSWDVRLPRDTTPEEYAALAALTDGEYGNGPFYWLDPWAQRTNGTTPEGSDVANATPATGYVLEGLTDLGGGALAGAALAATGSSLPTALQLPRVGTTRVPVPVRAGDRVTVSAWVYSGTATLPRIRLMWVQNIAPTTVPGAISPTSAAAYAPSTWWRASVTEVAPANAVAVVLSPYTSCVKMTRPAFTISDELLPWLPGQAAAQALFPNLDTAVQAARPGEGGQRAGLGFTVQEVGL